MSTAIVYHSSHHGNTKKLLDAIARESDVALIPSESQQTDLSTYELIGFASGIYYQQFHESVIRFAKEHLPQGKRVFLLYTSGTKRGAHTDAISRAIASKDAQMLGTYRCRGFDTFGPLKLIGGIAKGHPNDEEIAGAVRFVKALV